MPCELTSLRTITNCFKPCAALQIMGSNRNNWIPRRLTYSGLFWMVSIACFTLAVGDRLWVSETQGDSLLRRSSRDKYPECNKNRVGGCITEWFWIITARTLIVSLNIAFFTVMWMIPNFIEEAAPSFIDMDVRHSNWEIHKFTGIWLNGVVTVLHCVLLLAPSIIDGTPLNMLRDGISFKEWWDPWVRTFVDYIEDGQVVFSADEVFRLCLSIFVFCFLMPLSRCDWMMYKSYSVAMAIHALAGFLFMVDMVRKNSHPLCWRFNLPLIFLYLVDRFLATFFYRVHKFTVRKVQKLSDGCFVVYGYLPNLPFRGQGCGDNYWLLHRFQARRLCNPLPQRAHPYTSFQNWDANTRHQWNVGFVIQCNPKNKRSWCLWLKNRDVQLLTEQKRTQNSNCIAFQNNKMKKFHDVAKHLDTEISSTKQISEVDFDPESESVEFYLRSYGPYRSSFYVIGKSYKSYDYLVLIAGGSGFGYFMSAINTISNCERENGDFETNEDSKLHRTTLLYSSREKNLMSLYRDLVCKADNQRKCRHILHYTGKDALDEMIGQKGCKDSGVMPVNPGRMDVEAILSEYEEMQNETLVCVCASLGLLAEVKKAVYKYGLRLRAEEI